MNVKVQFSSKSFIYWWCWVFSNKNKIDIQNNKHMHTHAHTHTHTLTHCTHKQLQLFWCPCTILLVYMGGVPFCVYFFIYIYLPKKYCFLKYSINSNSNLIQTVKMLTFGNSNSYEFKISRIYNLKFEILSNQTSPTHIEETSMERAKVS